MSDKSNRISQSVVDTMRDLKKAWKSNRDIRTILAAELNHNFSLSSISRHTTDIAQEVNKNFTERMNKVNIDLASIDDWDLDEEIDDKRYKIVDGVVIIDYKIDSIQNTMEIPLPVVDDIFRDASNKPGWWRLTSYQIIEKHNLAQYSNPAMRVLNLLRSRMDLNQYCNLLSPATIHDIRIKHWDKEVKRVLTERARAAVRGNLDEDKTFNTIYQKEQTDYLLKVSKTYSDTKLYYKWLEEKINLAKLNIPTLPKYVAKNKDFMVVMFWDLHWWTKTHEIMEARVNRMVDSIIASWVWHVRMIGMGDWFETIAKGTWTMHADQHLDMKYFWPELWEKMFALFTGMFSKLGENWVIVEFDMLLWNHDRGWETNWEDRYRSAGYPLYMLIRESIKASNVKVNILIDRVNSIMVWETNYIVGHWEKDLMKMAAEEAIMMWGNRQAKYYIIGQAHLHSYKKKDGKTTISRWKDSADMEWYNYTKIIVPPMCEPWFYSEQVIAKRSAPWCVYIVENENCAPDVILKRL